MIVYSIQKKGVKKYDRPESENLDGEVSGYEHHVKDTDKEVCMSEYP